MIIVTGVKGFIGSNLATRLESPTGFDHHAREYLFKLPFNKVTHMYHMGAISSTTETDYRKLYEYNVDYSIRLLDKCARYGVPVSYASSAAVYGNGDGPINLYGASKLTVDLWVQNNIYRFKSIHGYRFYNVYGEGEEHKDGQASPISTFTKQAKETGQIKLFQTHDGRRDFIWVGDVCRIMLEENRPSGIYDVGTSQPQYFSDIAQHVAKKYGAEIIKIPTPEHIKQNYQERTCAPYTDDKCISVADYIETL